MTPILEAASVAFGKDFPPIRMIRSSEYRLVTSGLSLLNGMLPYFMLPGSSCKVVRVCARTSLDRAGISDLRLVTTLPSVTRTVLTLRFSEIFVRPFSGSRVGMCSYNLGVVPKPRRLSPAE